MQRERELSRGDDPQVRLEAALEADARLGLAPGRDLLHARLACEPVEDRCHVRGRDDEVQVADRLHPPAEAAGAFRAAHLRECPEAREDGPGRLARVPPEVPKRISDAVSDPREDLLLGLLAKT